MATLIRRTDPDALHGTYTATVPTTPTRPTTPVILMLEGAGGAPTGPAWPASGQRFPRGDA